MDDPCRERWKKHVLAGWRPALALGSCVLLLLPEGCAVVRNARKVQRGDDTPVGERTPSAAEIGLSSNSVMTVSGAVDVALKCHPSIVQAAQSVVAASAQVYQARSAYLPAVDSGAGITRATGNTAGAPSSSRSRESYSGSVSADLLIYDFGKTPAAVRQAYERLAAAEQTLAATRNDVVFGVRVAFFGLCKAQELEGVAEHAVRQYGEHLEQVKTYAEVGKRIRYDVTKAEVDLGNARLSLITARNDVSDAWAKLNRALGLAEDARYRLQWVQGPEFKGSLDEWLARARSAHPELLALRAQERLASAAVDQAIASLYPSLGLRGQYGGSGDHLPLVWNWSAAAQSALSLFTGWRETWRVEETVAQLRAARARLADREQQLCLELSQGMNALVSARQRVDLTELIVRQAQESLDLIGERYRVGQASALEVTDAQVALTGAQADRVRARFDYEAAAAQIRHAIGEQ